MNSPFRKSRGDLAERMLIMPLQYQDQVSLLKDILTNHQTDCCGSVSEYEQWNA